MNATGVSPKKLSTSQDDLRSVAATEWETGGGSSITSGDRDAQTRRWFEAAVNVFERLADFFTVVCGVFAARAIYEASHLGKHIQYPFHEVGFAAGLFALLFVYLMDWAGGYQRANSLLRIRETERILRVAVKAFLFIFPITFLAGQLFSRWLLALAVLILPFFLIAEKQLFWHCIRWMHTRGYGVENVLIYGAGFTGRRVYSALVRSPKLGLNPVAIIDDNPNLIGKCIFEHAYRHQRSVRIIHGPITKQTIDSFKAHLLIVAIPSISNERFNEVLSATFAAGGRVAFVPKLSLVSETTANCAELDGLLISELGCPQTPSAYEITKQMFDFVGAVALLAITFPLWVMIALIVRLDSAGPVLFSQVRAGREGRPFRLYKFRSMYLDTPTYAVHPSDSWDPRITRVGRVLRRTSLDELPQLINVLKGEMSLVGPRPEMPFIVEQYESHHRHRLAVMPGITGLWQLSADRAYLIHENVLYDLYYIRHRNFFMDVAILLHTVAFAMRGV